MGVKGLWELLSPVGRRVNIETLEGKILAIDASIWITQFINAMQDEEGKIIKNAHLIGTLRRILKLLHNRIKPVFVFDGATPTLKIQTVRTRRLLREKQEINVKKTAEKILLAKLKQHLTSQLKTNELLTNKSENNNNINNNNMNNKLEDDYSSRCAPGFNLLSDVNVVEESKSNQSSGQKVNNSSNNNEKNNESDDEWEDGFANLQGKNLNEGQQISQVGSRNRSSHNLFGGDEDFDDDNISNFMIPDNPDEIDSSTLASLPPTLRKHLIEEARKKESRKNRAFYLPVAEDPLLYSKTQLANFLRTSKLNQIIVKTQEESDRLEREKHGSGKIISSDGNRRYILQKKSQNFEETKNNDNNENDNDDNDDDMSWLNDSDDNDDSDNLNIERKVAEKRNLENKSDNIESKRKSKKRRIIDDEDDKNSNNSDGMEGGGFIIDDEVDDDDDDVESEGGGFIRDSPIKNKTNKNKNIINQNNHKDKLTLKNDMKEKENEIEIIEKENIDKNQWMCNSCTFFNESFDNLCIMCGTKKIITSTSTSSTIITHPSHHHSTTTPSTSTPTTSISKITTSNVNNLNNFSSTPLKVTSSIIDNTSTNQSLTPNILIESQQSVPEITSEVLNETNSEDEWESNSYSDEPIETINNSNNTQDINHELKKLDSPIFDNKIDDNSKNRNDNSVSDSDSDNYDYIDQFYQKEESNSSVNNSNSNNNNNNNQQYKLTQSTIFRAVTSASSMGDWAGRAVRRALQGNSNILSTPQNEAIKKIPKTSPLEDDLQVLNYSPEDKANKNDQQFVSNNISSIISSDNEVSQMSNLDRLDYIPEGNGFEVNQVDFDRRTARHAEVLSDGMVSDIKALLDAFDIPYISAPFEAEAQCAFLEMAGLVDGVITEDSDIFLFGGECVYKNIFDEKKYVEAYRAEDLKRDLGITRSDLIALAYLLGSDYTDGVKGIGIVNAMEIIDVFGTSENNEEKRKKNNIQNSSEGGFFLFSNPEIQNNSQEVTEDEKQKLLNESLSKLEHFKEWLLAPYDFQSHKFFRSKNRSKNKKNHNNSDNDNNDNNNNNNNEDSNLESSIIDDEEKLKESQLQKIEEFSKKHIGMRKKWTVRDSFPDRKIAEAYFSPQVNKYAEKFTFEIPKLFKVKKYVSDILGWTDDEISNKITPVIQKCISESNTTTQKRIDSYYISYYHDDKRFARIQSERLKGAVTRFRDKRNKK